MRQLERTVYCVSHWHTVEIILGNTEMGGDTKIQSGKQKRPANF